MKQYCFWASAACVSVSTRIHTCDSLLGQKKGEVQSLGLVMAQASTHSVRKLPHGLTQSCIGGMRQQSDGCFLFYSMPECC